MRHDVIVPTKPSGDGRLEARFRLEGGLLAMPNGADEVVFHRFDEQTKTLVPAIRYSGLKVWDAQGRVLPSTMELQDEDLVLAVVDEGAEYPITIDPISTTPDQTIAGTQPGESFGYSVATAGDVNGDGYSDVLVGSPHWNTPFTNAGRAQLFLGSATGIPATPAWTYQGQVNDSLGFSVSSAGDLNGDGYGDVAIGAPGRTSETGAVLVFTGSASGLGASPAFTLTGNAQAGCKFGWSVALAGDVNVDGYSDLLVGAPRFNTSGVGQGKAYCYHGGVALPTLVWQVPGTTANAEFGYSVAGAGDLNGDGASDVVIGEPFRLKSTLIPKSGAIHLFAGVSGTGLSGTASTMQQPGSSNYNVGYSVSSAGDLDGDGYADLVVGAPGATTGNGYIYVYRGAALATLINTSPAASLAGPISSAERLGHSVALAGDVNGDGYADIVVGSPSNTSSAGKVQVFRGDATVALDAAHLLWSRTGATANRLGAAVCTGGDVNGDGISDLLVVAPDLGNGTATVFHGAPDLPASTASWTILGTANNQLLGGCVATAGDVNGDGYSDVLVGVVGGAGQKGEVRLFLGSATGLPATPTWTKQGENVEDRFGYSVASAGDVNGDGYSDVIIGAPGWPNGVPGAWRGKSYLFLGSASGLPATAAWNKTGPGTESRFGFSVSSAGDVNGDGYSDVIIGASSVVNPTGTGEGAAYVFHGSGSGLPAVANWTAISQQHRSGHSSVFGACVSLAGDVNGDGYDDVIIGDPYYEDLTGDVNIGGAFVYHGFSSGLSAAPNWAGYGTGASDYFGGSLSYAGDVNGDGYSDVIVGANEKGFGSKGGAYVYHGSPSGGLGLTAAWTIDGTLDDDQLGRSVCGAGDVNGDGYGDVVIGVYKMDFQTFSPPNYIQDVGGAQVHLGGAVGLSTTPAWSVRGVSYGNQIGGCVALAGDVNGDGLSDIMASIAQIPSFTNAGGAYLYLGNAGRGLPMRTYQYRSDLSTQVRTSNSTFEASCQWGIGQFARSSMGRSKVKLAWHNEGHGPLVPVHLFNNNSTTISGQTASPWTDIGLSGVLIKQLLSTAPGATAHPQWRARVRHHPATALDGRVFGRWFMQGVNDLQVPSVKTELGTCGVLPVELLSFQGTCTGGAAHLEWVTATERSCANFVVERSSDTHAWQQLGVVACAGNSQVPRRYSFNDAAQPLGTTYYRIRQLDTDGSEHILPTVTVEHCMQAAGSMRVWPNPVSDVLHVDRGSLNDLSEGMLIEVIDATGRQVASLSATNDVGVVSIGMAGMAPGVYAVVARSSDGTLLGHARVVRE
jgi:hypothetical protein